MATVDRAKSQGFDVCHYYENQGIRVAQVQQIRCILLHIPSRMLHIEVQQIDEVQHEVQHHQLPETLR